MKQNIPQTKQFVPSSKLFEGKQTFSSVSLRYNVLFSQSHRRLRIWEELSSPGECGQLEYSSQQSQLLASVLIFSEKVCLNIQPRHDSGCVGDILVSMLYGILFYRLNDPNGEVAYYKFIADAGIPQRAKPVVSC